MIDKRINLDSKQKKKIILNNFITTSVYFYVNTIFFYFGEKIIIPTIAMIFSIETEILSNFNTFSNFKNLNKISFSS